MRPGQFRLCHFKPPTTFIQESAGVNLNSDQLCLPAKELIFSEILYPHFNPGGRSFS